MAITHITDNDIQAYLDAKQNGLPVDTKVIQHLENCRKCQKQVNQYTRLYEILAVDEGCELSSGFADRVVSSVIPQKASEQESFRGILLLAVGFCLGLVITAFFIDLKMLGLHIIESFKLLWISMENVFNNDKWTVLPQKHLNIYMLTGVILLVVSISDRLILHLKNRHFCL